MGAQGGHFRAQGGNFGAQGGNIGAQGSHLLPGEVTWDLREGTWGRRKVSGCLDGLN